MEKWAYFFGIQFFEKKFQIEVIERKISHKMV